MKLKSRSECIAKVKAATHHTFRFAQETPSAPPMRLLPFKLFTSKSRLSPTAASVSGLLTPRVSRSQSGVAAETQARMTDNAPNMLIVPQTSPAAPLFPSMRDSAVVEPIKAVKAAISIRPPPTIGAGPSALLVGGERLIA